MLGDAIECCGMREAPEHPRVGEAPIDYTVGSSWMSLDTRAARCGTFDFHEEV